VLHYSIAYVIRLLLAFVFMCYLCGIRYVLEAWVVVNLWNSRPPITL